MRTGTFVRSVNRADVLEEIRRNAPISRATIAKRLAMSRSAVSDIVDQLVSEGFVREAGTGGSTPRGGRPSVKLEFVPTAKYAFGIDIGATKTIFILTDLQGEIVAERRVSSHKDGVDPIVHIRTEAEEFLASTGTDRAKIVGTGIGAPGFVNFETGVVVAAPGFHWENVNLRQAFKDALPEPIFVDNDVNMALIGEKWRGNGETYRDVVFVGIGTGIGAALLMNGEVHRGVDGYAGEIGYFPMDPFTQSTSDAVQFGELEMLASGTGIQRQAETLLTSYPNSILNGKAFTSETVFEAAAKQDELALRVIDQTVKYIAFGLSHIVALLNPGVVIFGGGVSEVGESFISAIQTRLKELIPIRTTVVAASLGGMAGALGAAATPLLATETMRFTS